MTQRHFRRASARALLRSPAGAAVAAAALVAPQAALAQSVIDVCTGLGAALPNLAQVGTVTSGVLGGVVDPLLNGVVGNVNTGVVDALSGRTMRVGLLDSGGNLVTVTPGNCNLSASTIALDAAQGVSIGGGRTTGLGASGAAATAGHLSAIALGNGATTGAGLAGAAALGTNATAGVVGGLALGADSVANRAGLAGLREAFSANVVASAAGAVSVGAAGLERQITNVAGATQATDAVNLRQLTAVGANLAATIGAGAAFDAVTGVYVAPTINIRGTLYGDVGSALTAIDLRLGVLAGSGGTGGSGSTVINNYVGGATVTDGSTVRQDATTRAIAIGGNSDGRVVSVSGTQGDRVITGVANGIAGNDAVNVAQLGALDLRLTTLVDGIPVRGNNASGRPAPSASGADSLAIGRGAASAGANAVAIGNGASAAQANAVAIGNGATTTRADQVAIGSGRSTYTMAGIASDASAAAQSGPTRFVTTDAAGNLATSPYGPGSIAALDGRVGAAEAKAAAALKYAVEGRREARQGIAAAMAMTSASMPSMPGRTAWVMNTATFRGEWAAGGALAHRLDTNVPLAVTAGYAYGGGNSHGARVGLGGEF